MVPLDPIARFSHVFKSYGDATPVLRDLTLDIARGGFVTLLGPSGSGKSTALLLLAGFEAPDGGDVRLDGRPIMRTPAHRRDIGVVFQNYALFPHLTAAQNVAFPLAVRGVAREALRTRTDAALAMVQMGRHARRRPAQLSGGQQQRVALARALVFGPKLVLLDEPLAALDRQLREEMQTELRHLHRQLGVSMLYVTHDQAEALAMSDRIAVLHQGCIQQEGTPQTLYERPANAFVAGFFGESNRLPGRVGAMVEAGVVEIKLDAGPVVEAELVEPLFPGARCVVCIRPERIAVAATSAEDMGPAALAAVVEEMVYLGDHVRLRLRLHVEGGVGPEGAVMVRRPAGAPLAGLAPGQRAAIAWQPSQALVFAAPTPS